MNKTRRLIHAAELDDVINYLIYRSARILRHKIQREMKAEGKVLTQEQHVILFKLWRRDKQYQAELTDEKFTDAPNITRILDVMERKGLIEGRADGRDRRKFRICLTVKRAKIEAFSYS